MHLAKKRFSPIYNVTNVLFLNIYKNTVYRVSHFCFLYFFTSKRNKAKQKPFRFLFALFQENKKKLLFPSFRFISLQFFRFVSLNFLEYIFCFVLLRFSSFFRFKFFLFFVCEFVVVSKEIQLCNSSFSIH